MDRKGGVLSVLNKTSGQLAVLKVPPKVAENWSRAAVNEAVAVISSQRNSAAQRYRVELTATGKIFDDGASKNNYNGFQNQPKTTSFVDSIPHHLSSAKILAPLSPSNSESSRETVINDDSPMNDQFGLPKKFTVMAKLSDANHLHLFAGSNANIFPKIMWLTALFDAEKYEGTNKPTQNGANGVATNLPPVEKFTGLYLSQVDAKATLIPQNAAAVTLRATGARRRTNPVYVNEYGIVGETLESQVGPAKRIFKYYNSCDQRNQTSYGPVNPNWSFNGAPLRLRRFSGVYQAEDAPA